MKKLISTSLIAVGSFLLGGSLGLYIGGKNCDVCPNWTYDHNELNIIGNHQYSAEEMKAILDSMPMDGDLPEDSPYFEEEEDDTNGFSKGVEEYKEKVSKYVNTVASESIKSPAEVLEDIEHDALHGEPYIISVDAFLNEYDEYSKNTLSYYEGDDVLCDDRDEVVRDVEDYVGDEALVSFGEGSDDENVVYIRNHNKHADYEIVREEGSYAIDILGLDEEDDMEYEQARKFFNLDEDREE